MIRTRLALLIAAPGFLFLVPRLADAREWTDAFTTPGWLEMAGWQWVGLIVSVFLAWGLGVLATWLLGALALRIARHTSATWDDELVEAVKAPGRLFAAVLAGTLLTRALALPSAVHQSVDQLVRTIGFVALTWLAFRGVEFVAHLLEARATEGVQDVTHVRGLKTQVQVLRRMANVAVAVVGGALVLLQFDVVRTVGTSLLASAGIAGVVVGFAAQRSLSTLLAGLQISLTQPIRLGDTVIVESEWGWIEEITLTYVVVRIWDERRLIVPITKFLDTSFQNWTRRSSQIMGTVFVYADYSVPVEKVRAALDKIVHEDDRWDGRVCGLQVTDASERTVTLRALVSAADADKAWDLRCGVREKLIAFLQGLEDGRYLPRTRIAADEATKGLIQAA